MENSKKNLKNMSILVLLFVGLTLVRTLVQFFTGGFGVEGIPNDAAAELVKTTKIIGLVGGLILLLPQIYVGLKGLKVSKDPDSSTGHITWAKVLLVLSVIAIISPVMGLIGAENIMSNITTLVDLGVDVVVYFLFIKYAKEVAKS